MKKIIFKLLIASCFLDISHAGTMGSASIQPTSWTGFYLGGNLGGIWANPSINVSTVNTYVNSVTLSDLGRTYGPAAAVASTGSFSKNSHGVIGGVQFGYNYQINPMLMAGIETDIQGTNNASHSDTIQVAPRIGFYPRTVTANVAVSQQMKYFGTLRGNLGIFIPHLNSLLAYFTGGLAYSGIQSSTNITGAETQETGAGHFSGFGNISSTQTGYTVGGGIEKFFVAHWSVRAEYLYYDLGITKYNTGAITALKADKSTNFINHASSNLKFNGNIARIGLNFHFN